MERWPDRGAAIIPFKNNIILMRRERGYGKNKQVYYTIPGGGKEENETMQQTTIREIYEELGINIKTKKLLYKVSTIRRMQYIFLGEYISGKLGTGEGEEFQDVDYNKYGKYIPEVVSYEKLKTIKLVPVNLKREILKEFNYIIGREKTRKEDDVKNIVEYPRRKKVIKKEIKKENQKNSLKNDDNREKELEKERIKNKTQNKIQNKNVKSSKKKKNIKNVKNTEDSKILKQEKRIKEKTQKKEEQKQIKNNIFNKRVKKQNDNIKKNQNHQNQRKNLNKNLEEKLEQNSNLETNNNVKINREMFFRKRRKNKNINMLNNKNKFLK